MKAKLFVGVYIGILLLFIAMCVLFMMEFAKNNALTKQVMYLLDDKSQSMQITKLQAKLTAEQGEKMRMSSQIDSLQGRHTGLMSQVSKIRQAKAAKGKVAYLTFDDGPSILTSRVLDTLKANNVNATFFVVGTNAINNPDLIKREDSEGNAVGIHSWTHDYTYIYANENNFFQDFNKLRDYLKNLLGKDPEVCRYPGGTNESQGNPNHMLRVIDPKVKAIGIKPYDWNSSAGDATAGPKPTVDQTVRNVMTYVTGQQSVVILMHDLGGNGNDVLALPEIIRQIRAKGYTFGTLSQDTPKVQWDPR